MSSGGEPGGCKRLRGKTAVITGAAAGIGAAIARVFAAEGADLVLNDRDRGALAEQSTALRDAGTRVVEVSGDASQAAVARKLAAKANAQFGAIHILVNNAGVAGSALGDGTVTEAREDAWREVLAANLGPVFACSRAVVPEIAAAGGGAVVNISSVLALAGSADFFRSHGYVASKGAVVSLTRAMAASYADAGIRVNVLCPGLIDTESARGALAKRAGLRGYVESKQRLMKGVGSAEAVARAALFLVSDEAREVTGVVFPVDGGWTSGY